MSQGKETNRWIVVLGAILIQVCLGAVYAWSVFNKPLMSAHGWTRPEVALTFSVTIATMAIFVIIAGKTQDKIGPRWVATAGGIMLGTGLLLASQATELWQLYLFYGVIGGAGVGTAYVCPIAACVKWFPDKRGLITGISVAGYGAGALLFAPLINHFLASFAITGINPATNEAIYAAAGISQTFMILGCIYLIGVVAGAQFLRVPPANYVPVGWTPPAANATGAGGNELSPGQMLGTVQFYAIWLMFFFGCLAGLMVIGLASDIGQELVGLTAATAATAVMAISIFNAMGRIVWGTVSDKIGRINSLVIMFILAAIAMFSLSLIGDGLVLTTFLGLCSLIGFCFGGFFAIFPSLTADYFGTANLGTNYGFVFMAYGAGALVGPSLGTSVGFTQAFLTAGILCAIAAGLTFFAKNQPKALNESISA